MSRARDLADLGGSANAGTVTGSNLVINGDFAVAQRSTSSTGLGASGGYYTVDRFQLGVGGTATAGRLTMSQDSDAPDGFGSSLKLACTTADTSIAADENLRLVTVLEGQDLQQLKKGTSSAESVTLSFYVKGNASATYVIELYDTDNARHICNTFSVTTSWQRVEITFDGDTTGEFGNDNGGSLRLHFWLHAGSNYNSGTLATSWAANTNANRAVGADSFYDSTSNTFFITGVKLEVGTTATPFLHESYGENLRKCQRYYEILSKGGSDIVACGLQYSGSLSVTAVPHKVVKRAVPTAVITGSYRVYSNGGNTLASTVLYDSDSNEIVARLDFTASRTAGHAIFVRSVSSSGVIAMDAEL